MKIEIAFNNHLKNCGCGRRLEGKTVTRMIKGKNSGGQNCLNTYS